MAEKEKPAKKKKKGKTKSIHVRKADSGGFIASHEMQPEEGMAQPGQEHVLPDIEALKQHMQDHLGEEEEEMQQK